MPSPNKLSEQFCEQKNLMNTSDVCPQSDELLEACTCVLFSL